VRYRRIVPWLDELRRAKQDLDGNPGSAEALTRMAGVLNLAGEYEHARRWAERGAKLDPRSFQNAVQSGYILANLGDGPGARKSFALALSLLGNVDPAADPAATLRDYVAKLDRGEALPLPLGAMEAPPDR
jgi:tetratricopeptide (TPR) repeat protein